MHVSEQSAQAADRALGAGLRPSMKFNPTDIRSMMSGSGNTDIRLTAPQMRQLDKAMRSGRGCTMKMTQGQCSKAEREGGFLGALGAIARTAAPYVMKAAKPLLSGVLGGLGSVATKKAIGDGLYLSPPNSGGSMLYGMKQGQGVMDDAIGMLEDAAGHVVPVSKKILGKLVEHAGSAGKHYLGKVGNEMVKLSGSGMSQQLSYGKNNSIKLPSRGGFLSGILSSIGL